MESGEGGYGGRYDGGGRTKWFSGVYIPRKMVR